MWYGSNLGQLVVFSVNVLQFGQLVVLSASMCGMAVPI